MAPALSKFSDTLKVLVVNIPEYKKYAVSGASIAVLYYFLKNYRKSIKSKDNGKDLLLVKPSEDKKEKVHVDAVFFTRLRKLLKIVIPSWISKEAWYLLLVALSLVARTVADIWMITNNTQ